MYRGEPVKECYIQHVLIMSSDVIGYGPIIFVQQFKASNKIICELTINREYETIKYRGTDVRKE